jgi:large subunit ribosomal protein L10
MKTRETKQRDLAALTESLQHSKSAMVVSFSGVTVTKDQEFRNSLREAGANYEVVKNTLARIAVKGTQFEDVTEHLKGVTAIAWTDNDPVVLSKAVSKFMKDNADLYTFKTGVVDGKLVDLKLLTTIANLPSKDELIAKLLFVLNSSAQRLVTVINAVPRDLAIVIKQIGDAKAPVVPAEEAKAEEPAPAAEEAAPANVEVLAEAQPEETSAAETAAEAAPAEESPASAETAPAAETAETAQEEASPERPVEAAPAEEAPVAETAETAQEEASPERPVEAAPAEESEPGG